MPYLCYSEDCDAKGKPIMLDGFSFLNVVQK